jgi:hypothetical protein
LICVSIRYVNIKNNSAKNFWTRILRIELFGAGVPACGFFPLADTVEGEGGVGGIARLPPSRLPIEIGRP